MRVRTILQQMVLEGKYTGGTPPYGYKLISTKKVNCKGRILKDLQVVPKEAKIVQYIFNSTVIESKGTHIIANELNDKMMERFADECGSYLCNDLLKCDISTEEGVKYAIDNNLFTEFCPKMVVVAVDILEQIINEQES